ncbi:MAG: glycosyltransferase family 4 protein [Candidatus Omnitrophica bacterium]|nr:glycosyltransferase family 4 protein [Candidatus Omnitrophota bacterium]
MKILFVCYEDMAGYGGGKRQVLEIAKALSRSGNEIKVRAPFMGSFQSFDGFDTEYVRTINMPVLKYFSYLILSPFYFIKNLFKFRPDIVLFFEVYLDFWPVFLSKIFKKPLIIYVNGIAADELGLTGRNPLYIFLVSIFQKMCLRLANKVFVVTKVLKNNLVKRFAIEDDKIDIVKNGVDVDLFKPSDVKEAKIRLNFSTNDFLVGFVGGLFPWHGLDLLIESSPLILEQIPNVKFVIVGQGQMKDKLIQQVKAKSLDEAFIFSGAVPFKDIALYINAFDVCAVFFKSVRLDPGDPIKLYEYLACGKPVVASNVEGYGDFVEDIGAGISVDANNKKEVSEAIIKLIRDETLRKDMGRRGREFVVRNCTWVLRAGQIEESLRQVI